jgi:hypothetical protein
MALTEILLRYYNALRFFYPSLIFHVAEYNTFSLCADFVYFCCAMDLYLY